MFRTKHPTNAFNVRNRRNGSRNSMIVRGSGTIGITVVITATTMYVFFLTFTVAMVEAMVSSSSGSTSSSHANNNNDNSDYDKLVMALSDIRNKFASVHTILETMGVLSLPKAQQYGIFFGCITFFITIIVVVLLLLLGGTFQRILQEDDRIRNEDGSKSSSSSSNAPSTIREQRSLLYEELLHQRQCMMLRYNNNHNNTIPQTIPTTIQDQDDTAATTTVTELTIMLCNVIPPNSKLLQTDSHLRKLLSSSSSSSTVSLSSTMYETNYKLAYQTCQNRPGGSIVSGYPEARYESYAYGYSSCSYDHGMDISYRRSYGRMIESIICQDYTNIEYYQNYIQVHRPLDIIGTYIRLEPFGYNYTSSSSSLSTTTATTTTTTTAATTETDPPPNHVQELFHSTCTGDATVQYMKSYNPYDIWCFHDDGPFRTIEEIQSSKYLFPTIANTNTTTPTTSSSVSSPQRTASFVIRQNITHHFIGIIQLCNDEPEHLCIQIQIPIIVPKYSLSNLVSCKECIEAYFILLDRLFAYGYRRIYCYIDTQDIYSIQFITKLGFTYEGCLYKHRIVKNANRNSNIYAILNSDWKQTTISSNTSSPTKATTGTAATTMTTTSTTNYHYGARAALFKKLYGITKFRADISNEQYESEEDHKARVLSEKQQQQQSTNGSDDDNNDNDNSKKKV